MWVGCVHGEVGLVSRHESECQQRVCDGSATTIGLLRAEKRRQGMCIQGIEGGCVGGLRVVEAIVCRSDPESVPLTGHKL